MRKLSLALIAAAAIAISFSSCKDTYIDPTQDIFVKDTTTIGAYAKAQKLAVTTIDYGVRYVITQANPTGKLPSVADELEFMYTISKLDGTVIDIAARDTAIYFPYGLNAMLPGLEAGFSKVREGEKAIFLMPSYAAFGTSDAVGGKLPANTPVRFDVKLNRSRSEDQQIENFIERNKYTVAEMQPTGLRVIKTLAAPSGATLIDGQTVTVKYSGSLLRATKPFDTGGTIDVPLGRGSYVPGFETGLKSLKVGEKGVLVFPSSLGYGANIRYNSNGDVAIPPYSPLAFTVEIVSAK
ncbi:FKBP-type peptidyl-prolyl cis-trans isomerase [uncultured Fibrella sp.]|uniref:FKBP-type peptidyl-prolyl cis-trans isomerase n=1 Tax=uncultured Fibrella sp. TaxID=1284596 RepID=UPI0035CB0F42